MPNTLFHAPETPPPAERKRDLPLRPEAGTMPFRRLLERTLPPDVASELTAEFDPAAHRSSRIRIVQAALLTAAIAALAWFLFPRTSPEAVQALGARELHGAPPSFFSSYRRAYDRALEAYENRRYAACAEELLPHIAPLTEAKPGENAPLLLLFFDAIRAGDPPPEVRSAACDAASALTRIDPEDPRWRLCDLELNHRARLDYEELLRALKAGDENRIEELRMQGAAKDLQIRMKKIEEQLRLMQKLTSVDIELNDMPTDEEIEQLAAQEEEERRAKLEAEKKEEGKNRK